MRAVTGSAFGKDVCEALGLDYHQVLELAFEPIVPGKVVKVNVRRLVTPDEAERLLTLLRPCELEEYRTPEEPIDVAGGRLTRLESVGVLTGNG